MEDRDRSDCVRDERGAALRVGSSSSRGMVGSSGMIGSRLLGRFVIVSFLGGWPFGIPFRHERASCAWLAWCHRDMPTIGQTKCQVACREGTIKKLRRSSLTQIESGSTYVKAFFRKSKMQNIRRELDTLVCAYNLPVPTPPIHPSPGDPPALAQTAATIKHAKIESY